MASLRIVRALCGALLPLACALGGSLSAQDRWLGGKPDSLFTIGASEADEREMLSNVRQVAFDSRDNLYVLDAGNFRVLVFDASGRFVRQIGARGEGPGEFLQPIGLAVTVDDLLVVADAQRGGDTVFDAVGKPVRTLRWDPEAGYPAWGSEDATEVTLLPHPRGGVVMRLNAAKARPTPTGRIEAPGTATSPLVRYGTDGSTERLFEIPQPHPYPTWLSPSYVAFTAFVPPTLWGVLPGGEVVAAWNAGYRIAVASGPRAVGGFIERPLPPRPVGRTDRAAARERIRAEMDRAAVLGRTKPGWDATVRPRIEQAIADMTFMDVVPVLERLYTDPSGRLWVQRSSENGEEPGVIDLLAADGAYLGSLQGQKFPDAVSAGGRAAYVTRDSLDVQRVVVAKLPATWR